MASLRQRGKLSSRSVPWSYWDFTSVSYLLGTAHQILVKEAAQFSHPKLSPPVRRRAFSLNLFRGRQTHDCWGI
jgi:hypothetical protein